MEELSPPALATRSYAAIASRPDNTVTDNPAACPIYALEGFGAGVLFATPVPGGAVYNNRVQANTITTNGLPGVALHTHVPGQDLNGNVIWGNAQHLPHRRRERLRHPGLGRANAVANGRAKNSGWGGITGGRGLVTKPRPRSARQ